MPAGVNAGGAMVYAVFFKSAKRPQDKPRDRETIDNIGFNPFCPVVPRKFFVLPSVRDDLPRENGAVFAGADPESGCHFSISPEYGFQIGFEFSKIEVLNIFYHLCQGQACIASTQRPEGANHFPAKTGRRVDGRILTCHGVHILNSIVQSLKPKIQRR